MLFQRRHGHFFPLKEVCRLSGLLYVEAGIDSEGFIHQQQISAAQRFFRLYLITVQFIHLRIPENGDGSRNVYLRFL